MAEDCGRSLTAEKGACYEGDEVHEVLPPLLKYISASFMPSDSPDPSNHSGAAVLDLEYGNSVVDPDAKGSREGLSGETGFSVQDAQETLSVDFSKLVGDDLNTTPKQSTKEAAENVTPSKQSPRTPKSILSRRGTVSTPPRALMELGKKVSFGARVNKVTCNPDINGDPPQTRQEPINERVRNESKRKFFSQPIPTTKTPLSGGSHTKKSAHSGPARRCTTSNELARPKMDSSADRAKKENYGMFRTKSSNFEKQFSQLQSQGRPAGSSSGGSPSKTSPDEGKPVPAGRYFDALKGPELESVKDSEELLLPLSQRWPFLLRFPIGCFGICLGLGSQAMLWKALATMPSMSFLSIPLIINLILWCLALAALLVISCVYALKCLLYLEAVRREYYHPVRVNFFFAPWIACLFLSLGIPPRITKSVHPAVWCVFTFPILMMELKIYGQWLSGGQRRLSKVANPSTHLSLVGNFISALLAASVGWKEPAIFFWAVGCAHYLVVFVTLYQRLPTSEVLPKELHPVFFLFVAAPSAASVTWKTIIGSFDHVSRVAYFLGLFLYASLVVRINFFRGFHFSITWWAYTFPMTASAIATIHYSMEVWHPITKGMSVLLSLISSVTVFSVFMSTVYHALRGTLFPNDLAIAITRKKHKKKQEDTECDPLLESQSKAGMDTNKVFLSTGEGETIVASLENGLISVKSDPSPIKEH